MRLLHAGLDHHRACAAERRARLRRRPRARGAAPATSAAAPATSRIVEAVLDARSAYKKSRHEERLHRQAPIERREDHALPARPRRISR